MIRHHYPNYFISESKCRGGQSVQPVIIATAMETWNFIQWFQSSAAHRSDIALCGQS